MHKTYALAGAKYAQPEAPSPGLQDAIKNIDDKLHDAQSMHPGPQRDQTIKNYSSALNRAKGITHERIR